MRKSAIFDHAVSELRKAWAQYKVQPTMRVKGFIKELSDELYDAMTAREFHPGVRDRMFIRIVNNRINSGF